MYFDGSWKKLNAPATQSTLTNGSNHHRIEASSITRSSPPAAPKPAQTAQAWKTMPEKRYIGSFGVTGWATRSGAGLINYGDKITLERVVSQQSMRKTGKLGRVARTDVIVRFKNAKNEEVGRLEQETAQWISALLDQKVCRFQGSCVFAPDRIRTSDTIYLQLKCFLLRSIFASGSVIKPLDDNRQAVFFEAKESDDERALRMRQVALVKLFDEIKLSPSRVSAQTEKHKRQGLLQAAEMAEKYEQNGSCGKGFGAVLYDA